MREYQDMAEAKPDRFIRYEYPKLLDESREAVARILRAPIDTVVFVNNATTGVNTVLRNTLWNDDQKDEILYFSCIYGGCGKTIDYVVDTGHGRVASREIGLEFPAEDQDILARFHAAVKASKDEGKRPRICIFDVVVSMPGIRFPFEALTAACKELGIASLIDGAQGIGMVDIDLEKLDPDFFVSNCHKWLHVPRGCAVFYVPVRNQHLIQSSLPTSHGYVPRTGNRFNPLPPTSKSRFVNSFEFVGTIDNAPYLCVKDSIKWREDVLGGEARILEYQQKLAKEGGERVAEILGTEMMDNSGGTLSNCAMVNVALPLTIRQDGEAATNGATEGPKPGYPVIHQKDVYTVTQWMLQSLMNDHNTFVAMVVHRSRWWARLSAQVYLSMEDFEWAGKTLGEVCERTRSLECVNEAASAE